jgi:Tol biopolymer transport system component
MKQLEPSWSPDGRKILYMAGVDATSAIWMMSVDGTDRERILVSPVDDPIYEAAWRPG